MDEFLEQFLIEARELTTQAAEEIDMLERQPGGHRSVDGLLRVFHTLKGAAGIVDFATLGQLMHQAEEKLGAVQHGEAVLSSETLRYSLACTDLVIRWLDEIEASGELPAQAWKNAGALLQMGGGRSTPAEAEAGWAVDTAQLARIFPDPAAVMAARTAIRFIPAPECFFAGADPLDLIAHLPGLLEVRLEAREPFADVAQLDVFSCNLIIYTLSSAAPENLASRLTTASGRVDFYEIAPNTTLKPASKEPLPGDIAARVVEAQLRLLSQAAEISEFRGRVEAAGRSARHVMAVSGMPLSEAAIEQATVLALAREDTGPLIEAMKSALATLRETKMTVAPVTVLGNEMVTSLRVDMRKIDAIVKLVSELSVAGSGFGYLADLAEAGEQPEILARKLRQQQSELWRLIEDLQHSTLAIRVLPLRHTFQRFPRLVREIAARLGKDVALVTAGDDTDADKAVVEGLFEPLLHILRNAIDHGIENPERRGSLGKAQPARIELRSYRQSDTVVVEVADDGRGIDAGALKEMALTRGLVPAEGLAAMSDEQAIDLIFMPGFSTAVTVSEISGRGVGMSAVRSAVARLGGEVNVLTTQGQGTTIRLILPYSVMMSRILTIVAAGQTFGVPLETVVEMAQVPSDHVFSVGAARAVTYRGRTIPLISLPATLGNQDFPESRGSLKMVVARVEQQLCALEVDQFGERMDLMMSPRQGLLADLRGIAGTTLLGDGRVLVVLDLEELIT